MASSQPDDKGARPKTNSQSNSGHQKNKNEQGRAKHDNQSGSDVEKDSVPNSEQWNEPPGFHQLPYLVDVAVIYAKEDYDKVKDKFLPWLKRIAMKATCNLADARIYLYDDPEVNPDDNIFSQTNTTAAKCMKILAFITDNLMKDEILRTVLEELIMITKLKTKDEARQHISINKNGEMHPVHVKYLSECVQRQQKNALVPVLTVNENIPFIGLKSIKPVLYYDLEENSRFKEYRAKGVIKVAMEDRTKLQQYITNPENRDWSSYEHQNASSREQQLDKNTTIGNRDQNPSNPHATDAQLISNLSPLNMGNPLRNRLQNNNFSADVTSDDCNSGHNNNLTSLDQENEKKTEKDVSRTANTDCIPESSNTVGSNGQESSAEPRLEGDEGASESGNSQDEGLGSEHIHPSQVPTSTENSTLETSEETKISVYGDPAATPVTSNGDDTPETDLEEDQLESGRADNTEIKTVSALTESGYDSLSGQEQLQQNGESKPVKVPEETRLDNTGLVNDSGDAALGKDSGDENLKSLKEESMLSTDAQNSTRGLMAGNVAQKDSDRRCPAGSDVSGDLSSFEVNGSWQSEAENVLGHSLSDDLVSQAASEEDTLQQPHQWDAVKPDQCITTGHQIEAADHEGQGQGGTETCAERQPFVIGPQPAVNSLQTISLFASILSVKAQFHLHSGILRTNHPGMMYHFSMFLQEVFGTDHHKRDDDVD